MKKVDRELAEQVVALMVQIRNEALDEPPTYASQRPWARAAEGILDLDDQTVTVEFSSCLIHTEDDLAGNLDVMVRATPHVPAEKLSNDLRLALPAFDDLVTSDAYGELDNGIAEVSFGLANSAIGFGNDVRLFKKWKWSGATGGIESWRRCRVNLPNGCSEARRLPWS